MNASELLANTLSADSATRQEAATRLENASRENYPAYMVMLASELANESGNPVVRNAAGLALKNAFSARDSSRQSHYSARWLALDGDTKNKVKHEVLLTLGSASAKIGSVAAQVVSAIAAVELPVNQWHELVEILLGFVNKQDNDNLRIATLQAIGYICEAIKPEVLTARANEILTAVIHGARPAEPSQEVRLAAVNALYNSLEFVRENFDREGERNYIMQVVCEATQSSSVPTQVAAFECLVRIMSLYYDKMGFYMERALFGLTVMGMNHPEEAVALQAVEFWSTVCEEEIDLQIEAAEAQEYGEQPEHESKFFAKTALNEIIPVLLNLLTKQEEDADEEEWNVAMAAGTCLSLLAQAVQDAVVPSVIPFIESHIKLPDWHKREAAVMAFGSILDGPDPEVLRALVVQALPLLIEMMRDESVNVKDTTAWTLGRICDLMINVVDPQVHLHPLITVLVVSLDEQARIVTNCCWALNCLSDQLSMIVDEDVTPATSPLSPYYEGITSALLRVTEKPSNESNFRTAAYEALTSFVSRSATDSLQTVWTILGTILARMEHLLSVQNQLLGVDDRQNWSELQSNLCSVLISVIRKVGPEIQPRADRIMTLILQLIATVGKQSTVLEDAFLVVGSLAATLEQAFTPYINAFLPYLYPALKAHEDTQLCTVAVGLIGDISRALGENSAQYANAFMSVLLENLQSAVLNRNVKIPILACFGDIAMAIGPAYEPYLDTAMGVLRQAGQLQPNPLDLDLLDYVNQLREGILDAYVGIVTGFKDTPKTQLLLPHVPSMLELIQRTLHDEDRTELGAKSAIGLLGDLADTFPHGQIKDLLLADWIQAQLRAKSRLSPDAKKTLRWAREMIKRATQ
ncbi:ARM repeat-containing protein [Sistotremastrum suecicum HHB10207 ss-3]|uniref:Importin-95 n=1 Tax=Sistotremastrum suecicum HHB10207 ss-3 TaxID=1314776 RepID=A0A166C6H3_9AGAM|nr:ARM repeat-containing protein [Sistotremastrum suecicum HHB10207 ss-3]